MSGSVSFSYRPAVKVLVPHIHKEHYEDRIYTPDRYHCYIKKNGKYCVDRRGNGLNGRIVTASENEVSYERYENGYQSGLTGVFDNFGTMLSQCEYKKGVKHGWENVYFPNGRIYLKKHYKDGALDGRVEQYDINGAMVGKMNYRNGFLRDGYCKNEDGGMTMKERLKKEHYNEFLPCGSPLVSD